MKKYIFLSLLLFSGIALAQTEGQVLTNKQRTAIGVMISDSIANASFLDTVAVNNLIDEKTANFLNITDTTYQRAFSDLKYAKEQYIYPADYYVATWGNDNNDGSYNYPFATWDKAGDVAVKGDTVYFRGGTYRPTITSGAALFINTSGVEDTMICFFAYPNEKPVLDFSNVVSTGATRGIYILGASYIHIRGLKITNLIQNDGTWIHYGIFLTNGASHNIIENCELENIQGYPFFIYNYYNDCDSNLVLNCDSYRNGNPLGGSPWGITDGFNCAQGDSFNNTVNTFRGCRAWWNSDDGFDFIANNGTVIVENCWSFRNGYRPDTWIAGGNGAGFKIGYTDHTTDTLRYFENSMAWGNKSSGWHSNAADSTCVTSVLNCTAIRNGIYGFYLRKNQSIVKNSLAYDNPTDTWFYSEDYHSNNSWDDLYNVDDNDFVSLDTLLGTEPRKADGSLPDIDFGKLVSSSDLIDAGIDIGLEFNGLNPEIGSRESNTTNNSAVLDKLEDSDVVVKTLTISDRTVLGDEFYTRSNAISDANGESNASTGWLGSTNGTLSIESSDMHTGSYALKYTVGLAGVVTFMVDTLAGFEIGSYYQVSLWAKSNPVTDDISQRISDWEGVEVSPFYYLTNTWTLYNFTIQAVNDTVIMRVYGSTKGKYYGGNIGDEVLIDSLTIRPAIGGNLIVGGTVTINNYTLPTADGTAGYVFKTDGSGTISLQPDISTSGSGTFNPDGTTIDTTIAGLARVKPSKVTQWDSVSVKQNHDTDLDDLADGELTASKVGGVKDADYGDMTVSSGAWAVEDDSHNHVISNVDGLQTALDGKSATSHTHIEFADTFNVAGWSIGTGNSTLDTIVTGSFGGIKMPNNVTVTEVSAYTNSGTITFNIEERAETTPNTAGTDVMTSDLVADNDQQETSTFSNSTLDRDDWLILTIVSITGDPTIFSCTVRGVKTN